MNRSQNAFAFGARYGVFNSLIPVLVATHENWDPYFLSRSRIRYRGPLSHGVISPYTLFPYQVQDAQSFADQEVYPTPG